MGKRRVTLDGDAAQPTSPYAAYGAGMSIEDGYFLAKALAGISFTDRGAVVPALQGYEERRKSRTSYVTELAFKIGRMFHHLPAPLRPPRDLFYDHTSFLQKMIGDQMPSQILSQLDDIEAVA